MNDLYEEDVLLWSEQQAALLRRLAAGERVNEQIDWENVIDEVESAGSEQLHAVESLLVQALTHMLKAEAWPLARADVGHWHAEARRFRGDAAARFVPSMRQRIGYGKDLSPCLAGGPGYDRRHRTASDDTDDLSGNARRAAQRGLMKKTLAALRRREQRRTRDPRPERLLKYLRRQPQTLCPGRTADRGSAGDGGRGMRNGKIITAWTALAIIAAAPTAANAQTTAPREPRSCQQVHEETNKCEAGMRSCDQRVVDRLQARCQRDEKRLPQALGPRVGGQP